MRMIRFIAFTLLFALPFSTQTQAQDYKTLLDIPEGHTLVNLSASEQVEIEQDLLTATLRYEAENRDPKALQDEINTLMKKAVDMAKKVDSVKVSTQQYHVYQYDKNRGKGGRKDMVWKGQQGLMVKGKAADDLLELVGDLQETGLAMNGLNYSVSPERLEETRDSLLEDALKKLTAKATRTANALGKSKTEILQLNVDMGGYHPQPVMMRAMAMDAGMAKAEMATPVAAPGETQVSLSVSAQALLIP